MKLFILLTKFPDTGSRVMQFISGFYYTHASIGLEEDMNTFYSFVKKGFLVEKITRYIKPDRAPFPCQLYELEVSEAVYNSTKKLLNTFVENKSSLHYSNLGLIFGLFHVPFKRKYYYFCSHFVADVLKYSKATNLKKDSTLYLPGDLRAIPGIKLNFQGNLNTMLNHFGIVPNPA